MTGWRLLLTRPAEDSAALARELAGVGVFSSSLPLLDIQPLPLSEAQRAIIARLERYSAVIVVSKPAARLGLALIPSSQSSPALQKWFSVGSATARILADHGLNVDYPQRGDDSEALLSLATFEQAIDQPDARVLILRGEGGREMLSDWLRSRGVSVDYLELYRRRLPFYPPATLEQQIKEQCLNGLVVSSGQGFEHLRMLAGDAWPDLARLPLFVPSPRVADMARAAGAQYVVDCRGANAAALRAALREHPVPAFLMQRMDT